MLHITYETWESVVFQQHKIRQSTDFKALKCETGLGMRVIYYNDDNIWLIEAADRPYQKFAS